MLNTDTIKYSDIKNVIQRNSYDFSFVDTLGSFINNYEFSQSFRNFKQGKDNNYTNIWSVLSTLGDDYGKIIYSNVVNYLDNVANVDLCKIKALKSMITILGVDYQIIVDYNTMPIEILNLMDILSINKHYLFNNKVFNKAFQEYLSSYDGIFLSSENFDLSAELDTNISAISSVTTLSTYLDNSQYYNFLTSIYYNTLSNFIYLKYTDAEIGLSTLHEYIYEYLADELRAVNNINEKKTETSSQIEINDLKLKYRIYNFDEEEIVDNIENGYDKLDNYSEYEQEVISAEIKRRQNTYEGNVNEGDKTYLSGQNSLGYQITRYSYYREKKVKEYFKFIENTYNTTLVYKIKNQIFDKSTELSDEVYDKDTTYFNINDTVFNKLLIYDSINKQHILQCQYIEAVAQLLAEQTIELADIREQLKIQIQKTYIKGTFLFLSYIINEYLKNNISKHFGYETDDNGVALSTYINRSLADDGGVELIEYWDQTEYYNISTDFDNYVQASCYNDVNLTKAGLLNPKFWDNDTAKLGEITKDLPLEEIEEFYVKYLKLNNKGVKDNSQLINFLSIIYSDGTPSTFLDENTQHIVQKFNFKHNDSSEPIITDVLSDHTFSEFKTTYENNVKNNIDTEYKIIQNDISSYQEQINSLNETMNSLTTQTRYIHYFNNYNNIIDNPIYFKAYDLCAYCCNEDNFHSYELCAQILELSSTYYEVLDGLLSCVELSIHQTYWPLYNDDPTTEVDVRLDAIEAYLKARWSNTETLLQHLNEHVTTLETYRQQLLDLMDLYQGALAAYQAYYDGVQAYTGTDLQEDFTGAVAEVWDDTEVDGAYGHRTVYMPDSPGISDSDSISEKVSKITARTNFGYITATEKRKCGNEACMCTCNPDKVGKCTCGNKNNCRYPETEKGCVRVDKDSDEYWECDGCYAVIDTAGSRCEYGKKVIHAVESGIIYPYHAAYNATAYQEIVAPIKKVIDRFSGSNTGVVALINAELDCLNGDDGNAFPELDIGCVDEDNIEDVLHTCYDSVVGYIASLKQDYIYKEELVEEDRYIALKLAQNAMISAIVYAPANPYNVKYLRQTYEKFVDDINKIIDLSSEFFIDYKAESDKLWSIQLSNISSYIVEQDHLAFLYFSEELSGNGTVLKQGIYNDVDQQCSATFNYLSSINAYRTTRLNQFLTYTTSQNTLTSLFSDSAAMYYTSMKKVQQQYSVDLNSQWRVIQKWNSTNNQYRIFDLYESFSNIGKQEDAEILIHVKGIQNFEIWINSYSNDAENNYVIAYKPYLVGSSPTYIPYNRTQNKNLAPNTEKEINNIAWTQVIYEFLDDNEYIIPIRYYKGSNKSGSAFDTGNIAILKSQNGPINYWKTSIVPYQYGDKLLTICSKMTDYIYGDETCIEKSEDTIVMHKIKKQSNTQQIITQDNLVKFDLNSQWREPTKWTPTDEQKQKYVIYESYSNIGVGASYAKMYIKVKGIQNFYFWINSYAEASYDYTIAFKPDYDITSNPSAQTTSENVYGTTYNFNKNPSLGINDTYWKKVSYTFSDNNEHYIVVCYRKDSSRNSNFDTGSVAIPKEFIQKIINTDNSTNNNVDVLVFKTELDSDYYSGTAEIKYYTSIAARMQELKQSITEVCENLDFIQEENNVFLRYNGTSRGIDPYTNIKNQTHSSYQIHPYLYNFIEQSDTVYPLANTFYVSFLEDYEQHLLDIGLDNIIGKYGNPINVAHYDIRLWNGYQSKYEYDQALLNAKARNVDLQNFSGAFYKKALYDYLNDTENFIQNTQDNTLDSYYYQLNLTQEECNKIAEQLRIYEKPIREIVQAQKKSNKKDHCLSNEYDIYKYTEDCFGNSIILFKSYKHLYEAHKNDSNYVPSYNEKKNVAGELWVRLKNHPIAFPAFDLRIGYRDYTQYLIEKEINTEGYALNQYIIDINDYYSSFNITHELYKLTRDSISLSLNAKNQHTRFIFDFETDTINNSVLLVVPYQTGNKYKEYNVINKNVDTFVYKNSDIVVGYLTKDFDYNNNLYIYSFTKFFNTSDAINVENSFDNITRPTSTKQRGVKDLKSGAVINEPENTYDFIGFTKKGNYVYAFFVYKYYKVTKHLSGTTQILDNFVDYNYIYTKDAQKPYMHIYYVAYFQTHVIRKYLTVPLKYDIYFPREVDYLGSNATAADFQDARNIVICGNEKYVTLAYISEQTQQAKLRSTNRKSYTDNTTIVNFAEYTSTVVNRTELSTYGQNNRYPADTALLQTDDSQHINIYNSFDSFTTYIVAVELRYVGTSLKENEIRYYNLNADIGYTPLLANVQGKSRFYNNTALSGKTSFKCELLGPENSDVAYTPVLVDPNGGATPDGRVTEDYKPIDKITFYLNQDLVILPARTMVQYTFNLREIFGKDRHDEYIYDQFIETGKLLKYNYTLFNTNYESIPIVTGELKNQYATTNNYLSSEKYDSLSGEEIIGPNCLALHNTLIGNHFDNISAITTEITFNNDKLPETMNLCCFVRETMLDSIIIPANTFKLVLYAKNNTMSYEYYHIIENPSLSNNNRKFGTIERSTAQKIEFDEISSLSNYTIDNIQPFKNQNNGAKYSEMSAMLTFKYSENRTIDREFPYLESENIEDEVQILNNEDQYIYFYALDSHNTKKIEPFKLSYYSYINKYSYNTMTKRINTKNSKYYNFFNDVLTIQTTYNVEYINNSTQLNPKYGIVLYFNYKNYTSPMYINKTIKGYKNNKPEYEYKYCKSTDKSLEHTYLRLEPGENGRLDIRVDFVEYGKKTKNDIQNSIMGCESKIMTTYYIMNISDDKPKFVISREPFS